MVYGIKLIVLLVITMKEDGVWGMQFYVKSKKVTFMMR